MATAADMETRRVGIVRNTDFGRAMLRGLSQSPRSVPPKFFYDSKGSALFDLICVQPEYYPTRTEIRILRENAGQIIRVMGSHANILEFGAGSLTKIQILLDAFSPETAPDRFIPIDISTEHLHVSANKLRSMYPWLEVWPIDADYMSDQGLLERLPASGRNVGFFPGSTIGNLSPEEAVAFLRRARRMLMGGGLLIGVDLIKSDGTLNAAYNDVQGVTAAFNKNLLERANTELNADFDLSSFEHRAFYNGKLERVEMHLVSSCAQTVQVAGYRFRFERGESIHTENSHKFTVAGFRRVAVAAGFVPGPVWTDARGLFSIHWLGC